MAHFIRHALSNTVFLFVFYLIAGIGIWVLAYAIFQMADVNGNLGRLLQDHTVNLFTHIAIPYSIVLSAYRTAKHAIDLPDLTYLLANPALLLLAAFSYSHWTEVGGPNWIGIISTLVMAGVSIVTAIATKHERPLLPIEITSLKAQFSVGIPVNRNELLFADELSRRHATSAMASVSGLLMYAASAVPSAVFLAATSVLLSVAALFAPDLENYFSAGGMLSSLLLWFGLGISFFVLAKTLFMPAWRLTLLARRVRLRSSGLSDRLPIALYLRRFSEDSVRSHERTSWVTNALAGLPGLRVVASAITRINTEGCAIRSLGDTAQLVVVGRPSERLPPIGGKRIYLSDPHWQANVRELIECSAIVFIAIEFSASMRWEISQALTTARTRTVLLLPNGPRSPDWYRSWNELSEQFSLPSISDETTVIAFDKNGHAQQVRVTGAWTSWGHAISASLVHLLSAQHASSATINLDAGSRLRGSSIMRAATWAVVLGYLLGFVLPLLGIELIFRAL